MLKNAYIQQEQNNVKKFLNRLTYIEIYMSLFSCGRGENNLLFCGIKCIEVGQRRVEKQQYIAGHIKISVSYFCPAIFGTVYIPGLFTMKFAII